MTKNAKRFVILLVALLMCATVVFAACNKAGFKPVEVPKAGQDVESNGGIAVRYGDWLYYVNGYESNVSADNTYSDEVKTAPRIGSVVRIKLSEIASLFEINDDKNISSTSEKNKQIAAKVREKAETVVPKVYYSGNTTTTQFTGIYIFNERIYVTTPNDALTANGDPRTDELVLMSFNLGGGDPTSHFTFTSNSAQIWLSEVGNKVVATYLMDDVLHTLDVESGEDKVVTKEYGKLKHIDNTVSSANWDEKGKAVFFIDEFGSICKLAVGQANYEVILENDSYKDHGEHIEKGSKTFTIKFVNDGTVYYTKSDSEGAKDGGDVELYYATSATDNDNTASLTNSVTLYGWKENKNIAIMSATSEQTYYGISILELKKDEGSEKLYKETVVLSPAFNTSSVTINKIEGDILYYTADGVSYTIDLNDVTKPDYNPNEQGTPYAKNLASTTGWAAPDFIEFGDEYYIISLTTGAVTITKFDRENVKSNTVSVALTLTAAPEEK